MVLSRCHTCFSRTTGRSIVQPTGSTPCRVLFLSERPTRDEDRFGSPMSGRTGKEFTETYLPMAFLTPEDIFITNVVLCSATDYSIPEPIDAHNCMGVHLNPILQQVKPTIICPMGAVPCSLFPEIDLNLHHGIPIPGKWGAWKGVLFPMYNPTVGTKNTGYMIPLMQDFKNLGELLKGLPE